MAGAPGPPAGGRRARTATVGGVCGGVGAVEDGGGRAGGSARGDRRKRRVRPSRSSGAEATEPGAN